MAGNHGSVAEAAPPRTRTSSSKDRFDSLSRSGRVGVHRLVGKPRKFWIYLVSALLGIALITATGVILVQVTGASIVGWTEEGSGPIEPAAPKVKPALDPTAPVVVLNGTSMPGFGSIVDAAITSNAWGQILFSGDAATDDVQISAVFYSADEDEAAALGLAKELGGVGTFQSSDYDEYGARLIVLLGADYAGPGSDQFVPAAE